MGDGGESSLTAESMLLAPTLAWTSQILPVLLFLLSKMKSIESITQVIIKIRGIIKIVWHGTEHIVGIHKYRSFLLLLILSR